MTLNCNDQEEQEPVKIDSYTHTLRILAFAFLLNRRHTYSSGSASGDSEDVPDRNLDSSINQVAHRRFQL